MTLKQLQEFKEAALIEFKSLKWGCRLRGMTRALTEGECIALAYHIAAHKTGVEVEYPDSECETYD